MTLSVETKRNSGSAGANSTQESSNEIRSFEAFKPYLGRGFSQRACGGKYCASQRSIRRISCAFDRHLARESDAIQLRYRDDVTLVLVSAQFSTWWYRVRNYQQSRAPARPAHSRVWLLETGP